MAKTIQDALREMRGEAPVQRTIQDALREMRGESSAISAPVVSKPNVSAPVVSKPARTGNEIRSELNAVQDEIANTYGTVRFGEEEDTVKRREELRAKEKALKAELEAVEPTFGQKVGLAFKSIGNANVGSLWSLGETAVQGAKNTAEEFRNEEYRTTLSDLTAAKEKLRFAERSKNMSAKAMSDYEAALAEVNRLQAKLDSLQIKTSVGADSLGQQTLSKANDQKEAALKDTEGVGRWVGENLIGVAQNASVLPLAAVNPTLPAIAMGAMAAGTKAADVNAQGGTPGEALMRGAAAGGIEALTEKIPLDNILDMVKVGGKSAIKNLLKQAGTEATEESISYVLNYIADKAAGDPNATFDIKDLANAALSGAFSGGIMGGGATLIGNAVNPTVAETNKNTALPEVGSTVKNENGLESFSESEKVNLSSGARNKIISTFSDAVSFVKNALSNKQSTDRAYFGKIPTDVAERVLNETGHNILNYNVVLPSDNARHIIKNHGNPDVEASRDQVAVTVDDIALIPEVLAAPDKVYLSQSEDSRGRTVIVFEKQIGNNYVTMQAVSDGKHALQTDTLYIKQKKNSLDTGYNAGTNTNPAHNAQSVPPQSSSDVSVTDTEPVVNTQPFVPPVRKTEPVTPPIFKDGKVVNPDDSVGAAPLGFTGNVERGFSKNLASDQARHKDVQREYQVNPQMYFRLANKDTLNKAIAIMETGLESAKDTLSKALGRAQEGYKLAPEMVPLSKMVGDALAAEGRIDEMERILSDVAVELTAAGQLGQAAIILRDASPASKIQALEKAIAKINEEGGARYKNKWKDLSLTDAEKEEAASIAQGDEAAFEALYEKVAKRLGAEIPSTLWEKITEIRRIAMLLNPKTQVRNVVGNIPLTGMRKASESLSGAIQDSMVKRGKMSAEDQTRTRKVSERSKEIAGKLFESNKESLNGSADKWDVNGMIKRYRKYFGDNAVGNATDAVREFTYKMLEAGDIPFLKSAFVDNAAQYIEAQGYKSIEDVPQKVIDFATQQAMEATFKDFSIVASAINKAKKSGNAAGAIADVIMPFTTTPINILRRTIEYSPAGLLGVFEGKDAAQKIDSAAKALTGTGVIALGILLAKYGLITGGEDENADKAALDKATGKSPYSIAGRASYEWAQPIGTQLAMGAEIWDAVQNGENASEALLNALISGGDTLLDMTVVSNIKDLFTGYGSPTENIIDAVAGGFFSQLTPSLIGATARTIDSTVRAASYNEGLKKNIATGVAAKLPFASKELPAAIDVKGEEKSRIENPVLRAVQEFVNPSNINTGKRNAVDEELYRLYESTGSLSVFPAKAKNSVEFDSTTTKLTTEQKMDFQRVLGQTYYDLAEGMMETPAYKEADDATRVDILKKAEEYARQMAKADFIGEGFELESFVTRAQDAEKELGISESEFLALYGTLSHEKPNHDADDNGGYSNAEVAEAIKATGLPKEEHTTLWLIENPEWGDKAADAGVSTSVYVDFKVATIGKSKKEDILKAINLMGISKAQKDKLYYAAGYAESKIAEAPWR